jgi:hypothetical protein
LKIILLTLPSLVSQIRDTKAGRKTVFSAKKVPAMSMARFHASSHSQSPF